MFIAPLFLTHSYSSVYQRLERRLPGWAELHHQNILPLYGVCVPRTVLLNGSHGRVGIITGVGPRIFMVSERLMWAPKVGLTPLGIAVEGKWESA